MNWIAKALIQGAVARLPLGEKFNYLLQRVSGTHGDKYVDERIRKGLVHLASIRDHLYLPNATVFELGTGWDALHTVMLAAAGTKRIITVDHVAHLRFDRARNIAMRLQEHAAALAGIFSQPVDGVRDRLHNASNAGNLEQFLSVLNIEYRAPAVTTRLDMPDSSVDIVYSHLVLSYVPQSDLVEMTREIGRILRPGGVAAHRVRLADPFEDSKHGDRLDFLRYSDQTWGLLCKNSVQYNNRLRACQLVRIFEDGGGLSVLVDKRVEPGDIERARAMQVDGRFQSLPPEELAVSGLTIVSQYRASTPSGERYLKLLKDSVAHQDLV